jgi:carbonic anhydrase/acetyltransferase-like protein (isoleucine patch superfamily)
VHPASRIAPTAVLCGDVTVGPNCSIGFGAVLTAESGPIVIGANCVIMDTAVLRGVRRDPLHVGDNVLIGPRASLSGCRIGDSALLATGATVFNGAEIGERAEVRINALVHLRTRLPPDAVVPHGWVAVGDPAEVLPPDQRERIWAVRRPLNFPLYVFGFERPVEGETFMPAAMRRYSAALARWHAADQVLE